MDNYPRCFFGGGVYINEKGHTLESTSFFWAVPRLQANYYALNVVIHFVFNGMRAQAESRIFFAFDPDIGFQEVAAEDIALQ